MPERKYVVLIKQVPNMDEVEFDYDEGRIDRSSAPLETNPFDLNALEEAVRYKEEIGGEVTAISMGPEQAESTLRDALARGADRGILLQGREFVGSDTWATSLALGRAIEALEDYDLIFAGEKTVDGDTGQVGPEVAELLGIPHAAFVSELEKRRENSVSISTKNWGKSYRKRINFPGLLTVTKDVNQPRIPSFKDKNKARKAEIITWGVDDFSINAENLGIKGSPTKVAGMEVAPPDEREPLMIRKEPENAVNELMDKMSWDGVLR